MGPVLTSPASGNKRVAAAYAMYEAGATLEEVGQAFGVTRERVRQLFRQHGLPTRGVRGTYQMQRALTIRKYAERIKERFRALRDVDLVAQELELPRSLVATVVTDSFTPAQRRKRKATPKKYTDEELIGFLQIASQTLGGVLTAYGYTEYSREQATADGRPWPTHQTHALRFGSWRDALKAAGLAANRSSGIAGQRIFGDGHCIDALRAAARALERPPTAAEYEEFARTSNGAFPSQATVRHRLGKWYEALERAGL